MRKLTDGEVQARAENITKRHRSEWCKLVYEACVDRSMQEVATLLGYTGKWVADHLKRYAIEAAAGGGDDRRPIESAGKHGDTREAINHVVTEYAPDEPAEEYVAEYEAAGHTPEVAKCLARSYEAGENAVEAGVLQKTTTKQDEQAAKIVLPDGTDWAMRLKRAVADVKSAAGLLDRAKINDLKRAATRKYVAQAHAAWMEQIERMQSFHPTFDEELQSHEA